MSRLAIGLSALTVTLVSAFEAPFDPALLAASGTVLVLSVVGHTLPARALVVRSTHHELCPLPEPCRVCAAG